MTMNESRVKLVNRWKVLTLSAFAALGVAVLLTGGNSIAQVTKGKTRPLTTKQWMQAVHKVHGGAIKEGLDASPSDEKAWAEIALHAAMMNESSYVLMADGRCPDAIWESACKTLRDGSNDVLKAVDAKDVDSGKAAFGAMTKACSTCHKAHKK